MFKLFLVLFLSTSCYADTCDQQTYDLLYKTIIRNALKKKELTSKDFKIKNDSIEMLRKLCKGQKSSFEVNLK